MIVIKKIRNNEQQPALQRHNLLGVIHLVQVGLFVADPSGGMLLYLTIL
jgi:hypothetical protein